MTTKFAAFLCVLGLVSIAAAAAREIILIKNGYNGAGYLNVVGETVKCVRDVNKATRFVKRLALNGMKGGVSFQVLDTNLYLRHYGFILYARIIDAVLSRNDASFKQIPVGGSVYLRSSNFPMNYIMYNSETQIKTMVPIGPNDFDKATWTFLRPGRCAAGNYMTADWCKQCPKNTYSVAGATSCTDCPNDRISAAGSTSRYKCRDNCDDDGVWWWEENTWLKEVFADLDYRAANNIKYPIDEVQFSTLKEAQQKCFQMGEDKCGGVSWGGKDANWKNGLYLLGKSSKVLINQTNKDFDERAWIRCPKI